VTAGFRGSTTHPNGEKAESGKRKAEAPDAIGLLMESQVTLRLWQRG